MDTRIGVDYRVERIKEKKQEMEPNLVLLYVIRGEVCVQIYEKKHYLKKKDVLLINPGVVYETVTSVETLIGKCSWSATILTRILKGRHVYFYYDSSAGYSPFHSQLQSALENLTVVYAAGESSTECLPIGYLFRILDLLIEHFQIDPYGNAGKGAENTAGKSDSQADAFMIRIIQYIMHNLSGELSLTELADEMFVSASTLSRVFKKHTGLYFADYVMQLRVKEAVALLLNTEENLTQIALHAGFSGSAAFNRSFRKVMGEAPGEYRERMRSRALETAEVDAQSEQSIREEILAEGRVKEDGIIRRLIHTDLSHAHTSPLVNIWNQAVNLGEVSELTKTNVRNHCLYLRDHLHFRYIRLWNLFSRNLMLTDGCTVCRYNFTTLDNVIDFLRGNGLKPFLDFGRRPSMALDSGGKSVYFEETYTEFRSRDLWEEALRQTMRHLRRRYGREETATWIFEFSRDGLHGPLKERCYADEKFDFFDAWQAAFRIVRCEVPGALFGGVSASIEKDSDFLTSFFRKCKENGCVPDFCSFVMFPFTDLYDENGNLLFKGDCSHDTVRLQAKRIRSLMEDCGIGDKLLFFTEWNSTIESRDYLNDSCFRAAFFADGILGIREWADLICVMGGSDWINNYMDTGAVIYGGIGLLTKDTIQKSAFLALELMNRLGRRVLDSGDGYLLTLADDGCYYMLAWLYVPFDQPVTAIQAGTEPDLIDLHIKDHPTHVLSFHLSGMPQDGYYGIKRMILSASGGSILNEWGKFQFSDDLIANDIRYLRERCIPEIRMQRMYVGVSSELSFEVELKPEDVVLVYIYPDA